ncbi:FKBP-type peptidyl-prolyl cis-trans isomerase [Agrococcus sediminis]|jgi:peptidylprolyl isomerase|uniref:FKBP-type peptidyl-prolyl cis-trans isomerase n=1 Tax=Agrococcus sediminis TaxID=2599924 RepID=UPI00341D5FBA
MTEKPEIEAPEGPAPTELEITDITVGDGEEAVAGKQVSVHYVGVTHSGGEEFDASYNRGAPLEFPLGVGMVIKGWEQGIEGMRVGGRRRLVIPPHLAYGERGAGGVIGPNETLIFVCDLVAVK